MIFFLWQGVASTARWWPMLMAVLAPRAPVCNDQVAFLLSDQITPFVVNLDNVMTETFRISFEAEIHLANLRLIWPQELVGFDLLTVIS